MKFLCDRCKTRYSIADERVRGKILKIRCKNCSNVIAVREGMPEPEAETPAAAESRRSVRPTDFTPAVMAASPLQAAFAQAMQKPAAPPSQLEEEWYVSIDGDQSGPYALGEAQAWVGARKSDDELFCWCEGFDDWLPVEKVSHFRGLRVKPRAKPATTPPPTRVPPPPPAPRVKDEEEPKPLFAAALAALEADVKAETAAKASAPASADRLDTIPEPRPDKQTGPAAAVPVTRVPTPLPPLRPRPASSIHPALDSAGPAITASPAIAAAAASVPVAVVKQPSGRSKPASRPASSLFDVSEGDALPAPPVTADGLPAAFEVPAAPVFEAAPPSPSNGNGNSNRVKLPALLPVEPADDDSFDSPPADDLAIGEVSRVVRLADIVKRTPSPKPKPAARTSTMPALGRGTEAVQSFAESAAPSSALAHAASASLRDDVHHDDEHAHDAVLSPVAVRKPRRSHAALYAAIGVVLVAAVALIIVLSSGDDTENASADDSSGGDVEDLALTREDPRYPRNPKVGSGSGSQTGTGSGTAVVRTGSGGKTGSGGGKRGSGSGSNQTGSGGGTGTGAGTGTGKTEVVMRDGEVVEPLTPDDVITQAGRMSTGTQRCYSRALKEDPFLKVKSIGALITITKDGKVTEVSLDSMQTTNIGLCLAAAIKRWPFRKSTEGINTKITLKFQQGGM